MVKGPGRKDEKEHTGKNKEDTLGERKGKTDR